MKTIAVLYLLICLALSGCLPTDRGAPPIPPVKPSPEDTVAPRAATDTPLLPEPDRSAEGTPGVHPVAPAGTPGDGQPVAATAAVPRFNLSLPFIAKSLPPLASFTASQMKGVAPLTLVLDGSASWGERGIVQYAWDFGDGQSAEGAQAAHIYMLPGVYTVRLRVTDDLSLAGEATLQIQVLAPPFRTQNVILLIGDGMGFEQVRAGGMFLHGGEGTLVFETFPYQAEVITTSADANITDSAAAVTAMATGRKVNNETVGVAIPGDGSELYTLLEYARDHGMSTGLVTTTYITHATPAGFAAHTPNRINREEIAADYLRQTRPNVLFGGGGEGMTLDAARASGYTVVTDWFELLNLDTEQAVYVSGQFGSGNLPFEMDGLGNLPSLSDMTGVALRILDNDPDGFFLMIEGGKIDEASHAMDLARMVYEMTGFTSAVQEALAWASGHPNTLILITADHETGGLFVNENNGQGQIPGGTWQGTAHTGQNVPLYYLGPYEGEFPEVLDNTAIPSLVTDGRFP